LLAAGGGEQFEVDAFQGHAVGLQAVAHGLGHFLRAADEGGVEGFDIHPAAEQLAAFVGVDAAVVQVDVLLLAAEHENQVQALQVTVLQVFELSRNSAPELERLPYSRVTRLCGSLARVVLMIDRIGVMPLPAATAR
jgi:hypothetical protein